MKIDVAILELGALALRRGVALWQGIKRSGDSDEDIEPMGDGDVFQGLGLTSAPYPSDGNGKAEGIGLRGVGGRLLSWIGARDTRSAAIVGNLKPGDTVVHSTGPQQAAQIQLKEEKRQVAAVTKDASGKTMVVLLDGNSGKFQIVLNGMMIDMDPSNKSITLTNGAASILMQGGTIALDGNVILGGKIGDPVNKVAIAPGLPPGVPAAPGIGLTFGAAPGVAVAVLGG